jgi:hypothetical protein
LTYSGSMPIGLLLASPPVNHSTRALSTSPLKLRALRLLAIGMMSLVVAACSAATQPASAPTSTAVQSPAPAPPQSPTPAAPGSGAVPAAVRLNELGPQNEMLARRAGLWDVTETVWDHPGAQPVITTDLVAERTMMGSLLQEFLRHPSDTAHKDINRTDLLTFNRLQSRWDYVSFDARSPVGLMPASSSAAGDGTTIDLVFVPFAIPGPGVEASGLLLRMEQVIEFQDPNHDVKNQYFTLADGTGTKWLAHRYEYTRRS